MRIQRAHKQPEVGKLLSSGTREFSRGEIQHKISLFFLAADRVFRGGSRNCASRGHVPMGVTAHGSPSGPLQFDRLGSRPWPPMRRVGEPVYTRNFLQETTYEFSCGI